MAKRYVGKGDDLRVRKTERAIRDATLGLLEERPGEIPSAKEIIARAEVNKSTFYYHYESVEDLLKQMEQELFGDVMRDAVGSIGLLRKDPEAFLGRFADFAYAGPTAALRDRGNVKASLLEELLQSAGVSSPALEALLLGFWGFSRRVAEAEFRAAIPELAAFVREGLRGTPASRTGPRRAE